MDWCEQQKIRKKEKYEDLKSKGICTQCRKEKAVPGFTSCKACRKKAREKKRAKAQSNRTTDTLKGVCEEVAKYNEEHGTDYSYGYYSALKFRGLI